MYRILLVDDEPWILEGLLAGIPWAEKGYEVCGTAENGLAAYEKILSLRPDVVLADIRMPGMDGLTLLKQVRQKLPQIGFAFLSGYADFQYAQEGIRHGVDGYLLKPVEETELYALLERIGDKVAIWQQQALLDDLDAGGTLLLRKAYPQGAWLWIQLGGPLLPSLPTDQGARSGSARCVYVSRNLPSDWAGLEALLPEEVRGLGLAHWDKDQPLDRALQHAREAAYSYFFQPGTRVNRYRPLKINRLEPFAALRRAAMGRSARDIHFECERLRALLPQMNLGLLNQLWMIAHAVDSEADLSPDALTERFAGARDVLDAMERALLAPIRQGPEADMEQVDAYLQAHHRENLSIDELAAHFAMSSSALYQKFKQYAGCGIAKRIQDLRLRVACSLLAETELPVNDVAHAVGYEDALYFRKVFRKVLNTTPSAYRGTARQG